MRRKQSVRIQFFAAAVRAAIKLSDWGRRAAPVLLLVAALFAGAAVWLTASAGANHWVWKGWERVFGPSSITNARPRVFAQIGGSGAYTITALNEPSAGTSATEGTIVFAVNASGAMTGGYSDAAGIVHGFVYTNGTYTSFDATSIGSSPQSGWFQGTIGIGIDTAGDVVGAYADSNNAYHGFLLKANSTTPIELDDPNAPTATSSRGTFPMGINDNGQIVGFYSTGSYDTPSLYHGFLYSIANGTFTEIDDPNAGTGQATTYEKEGTSPTAINASGVVTGFYTDSSGNRHGFIATAPYSSGDFTTITVTGATTNTGKGGGFSGPIPLSIDAAGDVVGAYTDSSGVRHGFILPAGSTTATSFDAPGATTTSQSGGLGGTLPTRIDPTGSFITGMYTDSSGLGHGFVYYLPLTGSGSFTTFTPPDETTSTSLPIQGGVFGVNASGTVAGFYLDSNEVAHGFEYTPTATPTPTFSVPTGTYSSEQSVTLSDTDTSATIYYSTDGSTPTLNSTKYTEPISVSSTETINAIALDSTTGGYIESAEASAKYTINISSNPLPALYSLSPAFTSSGGTAFTLTATGTGFISGSTMYWGSTALTTTYVSATQLTAQVPASDITSSGTTGITVQTPAPGGGTSDTREFEVDSGSPGSGPTFTTVTARVYPGTTAIYPVTLPSGATNVTVTCLNLPVGTSCSYSASSGSVSITTSAGTQAETFQITVVFTETLPGAGTGLIVLPILLLPLAWARRRWMRKHIWITACFGVALLVGVSIGCGGGGGNSPPPQTHTVTSSGVVTLTVILL